MAKFALSLAYIVQTGTEVAIDETLVGKKRVISKEHSFFVQYRKILLDYLKRYDIQDVKSDKELYSYINQNDAHAILLKKLQDHYQRKYLSF